MRNRLFILSFAMLLLSAFCHAQDGRYSYGIDPDRDSVSIKAIRAKMDSVRACGRPAVAVVLSGGGAKGAAHVGVLKYLEKLDMPIDLILGTSMGGLVGGWYAMGYPASEIDRMIRQLDWEMLLSDKVPDNFITFSEKRYRQQYLISIPFYYAKDKRDTTAERHKFKDDLHLGIEDAHSKNLKDEFLSSLPSGLVFGQNVNNLFSQFSVGYQNDTLLYNLPIPFACIATEMVTAKPKVWYSGKLNTALRSTMSIPGLFTPVKTDGMVLVDGGMRNNYPTDLAYDLGADFVIGVDLSGGYLDYEDINNFGDLLSQFIDMFGRESYERNNRLADVTLKPVLKGYDMLSFDSESIDTIISRGWESAVEAHDDLMAMKELLRNDTLRLQARPAINIQENKVLISDIQIDGVSPTEFQYLIPRLKISPGTSLGKEEIENAAAYIYGTQAFEYVTYELLGSKEPFRLRFNCKKGPIHKLGLGARFDTEEVVSALVNIGINVNSIRGHAFDLTGKVGINPYVQGHYYYKTEAGPTINGELEFRHVGHNRFLLGNSNFNLSYYDTGTKMYLSNIKFINMDIKGGIRSNSFHLKDIMASDFPEESNSYADNTFLSLFASGKAETFDNAYFPTKGISVSAGYSWVFGGLIHKIEPFHVANVDFRSVIRCSDRFSILPNFNSRMIFGRDIPIPYTNIIGGRIPGRYLEQQVPFIGVTSAMAVDKYMAILGTDLRYKIFKNNYVSAKLNLGTSGAMFKEMFDINSNGFLGMGLEYAYSSIIGPIKADIHWSNITGAGAYLSIGFDF